MTTFLKFLLGNNKYEIRRNSFKNGSPKKNSVRKKFVYNTSHSFSVRTNRDKFQSSGELYVDDDSSKLKKIRRAKADTLSLVIGEDIPENKPSEYYKVDLYKKVDNGDLVLYANIVLPYLINHAELFMVDEEDPRYFMYEGYEEKTGGCKYSCMIKPYGEFKGIYRLGLNTPFKIRDINVLIEEEKVLKRK